MPLSTNKVEKFVLSGKFNCVYLANLADGSIIEYQEKNSFSSKNKKGLSIAIYGWSNFSSEDNRQWDVAIRYPVLRPMEIPWIDVNVSIVAMVMFLGFVLTRWRCTKMFILHIIKIEKVLS